uniref:Uncharacterized protein n=1 Tax=Pleurotus eryngii TaxID=5323 RepID=A0A343AWQ4_PLEER|nr:hypothetical protein [Pleurotus eryngii]APT42216.1 hypothetical protein [Pleurotus eryngii]
MLLRFRPIAPSYFTCMPLPWLLGSAGEVMFLREIIRRILKPDVNKVGCVFRYILSCYAAMLHPLLLRSCYAPDRLGCCYAASSSAAGGWTLLNFCSLEISKIWNNYKGFIFYFLV